MEKDTGEMTEVIFIWIVVVVSCVCTAVKSYLIVVCFFVFEVVCINICCTLAKFKGKKTQWRTTRNLNELNSKVNRQEAPGEMRPVLFSSQKK